MPGETEYHHPKNVTVYQEGDLFPELNEFEDILFTVSDMYSVPTPPLEVVRDYAVKMTRSHFGVTIEEAMSHFEIIIIPHSNIYEESGRIFARRIHP